MVVVVAGAIQSIVVRISVGSRGVHLMVIYGIAVAFLIEVVVCIVIGIFRS